MGKNDHSLGTFFYSLGFCQNSYLQTIFWIKIKEHSPASGKDEISIQTSYAFSNE